MYKRLWTSSFNFNLNCKQVNCKQNNSTLYTYSKTYPRHILDILTKYANVFSLFRVHGGETPESCEF